MDYIQSSDLGSFQSTLNEYETIAVLEDYT